MGTGRSRGGEDPWSDADAPGVLVGSVQAGEPDYQPQPFWWQQRWRALPGRVRRLVAVLSVLAVVSAGGLQLRAWQEARDLAQRVALSTSLGVWTSSTARPYGYVSYFVQVRNDGVRPLAVTAVELDTDRLRLRMRSDEPRRVEAGQEIAVLVSVRLTCGAGSSGSPELPAEVSVQREDGGSAAQRVDLQPSALILDVANTLCVVRPALTDHEISGPVSLTAQGAREGN